MILNALKAVAIFLFTGQFMISFHRYVVSGHLPLYLVKKSQIYNISDRIALYVVSRDLTFVKNIRQTLLVCKHVVRLDANCIKDIKHQTPEICLEAVKKNGFTLQYVKQQTHEICSAAVAQNCWAIEFVQDQTPELCLCAVNQEGLTFTVIRNRTREIREAAIKQNPSVVDW
jgi:hypothetical protein